MKQIPYLNLDFYSSWLTKLLAPITATLAFINSIVQFVQFWRGDQGIVTRVLWFASVLLILVSLHHIGYSRILSPIIRENKWGKLSSKEIYKYGETVSKVARTSIYISILLIITFLGVAIQRNNVLKDKVVVLVADFDGPDKKNYQVTQILLSQLSNSLASYNDILIIPLNKPITEQEGSKKAQSFGKEYQADLVVWGWYGVTESDVLLAIHVENLSEEQYLPIMASNLYGMQLPVNEIKSFQIQQKLSSQMTALTLFLGGIARFEADDYEDAINRFSGALNEQWPDELTSKIFIYYYRGLSYLSLLNIPTDISHVQKAIDDFSKALEINPKIVFANYYRALGYSFINDYENAKDDYELIIGTTNESLFSFTELATLSTLVFELEKAIKYFSLAIEDDPNNFLLYNNRASLYLSENEYTRSLNDINKAIKIEPDFYLLYSTRAETYINMGEYENAIKDINYAIDLISTGDSPENSGMLYFRRGFVYSKIKQFDKALIDYTYALKINSSLIYVYEDRGRTYMELGEYEKAIEDFTFSIENDNSFLLPDNYFSRGTAFEKLGKTEEALTDFSYSAQAYADFSSSFYRQGDIDHANAECARAISNFQELSENNRDKSIIRLANAVVNSFRKKCPSMLDGPYPAMTWQIRLSNNPIIPDTGLAGIKIGDSVESVRETLDDGDGWFKTEIPNYSDCCFGGIWVSNNASLTILFTNSKQEVFGFILQVQENLNDTKYIPFIKDVSIGTSETELLSHWGDPIATKKPSTTSECTMIFYPGIKFRVCGNDRLIDFIEIPDINY